MSGHQVFVSNDGGNTCSATGIDDNGSLPDGGSYSGFGKLYYDKLSGCVVEPAIFDHGDGSFGVGISTMPAGGSDVHAARGGRRERRCSRTGPRSRSTPAAPST